MNRSKDGLCNSTTQNSTGAPHRVMADVVWLVVTDWRIGLRVVLLSLLFLGSACLLGIFLFGVLPRVIPLDVDQFEMTIRDGQLLVRRTAEWGTERLRTHLFLLPASRLWADTGIRVKEGNKVSVRFLSGGVNVATHRSIEASLFDFYPPQPWTYFGTFGGQAEPRSYEAFRKGYLMHPEAAYGELLMCVWPDDRAKPVLTNSKTLRPPQNEIAVVSEDGLQGWKVGRSGTIRFCINDILVDSINAYVGPPAMYEERAREIQKRVSDTPGFKGWLEVQWEGKVPDAEMLQSRAKVLWQERVKNYPNIWYDDNIGFYLIIVEIKKVD